MIFIRKFDLISRFLLIARKTFTDRKQGKVFTVKEFSFGFITPKDKMHRTIYYIRL